jgi:hypothetical protein
MSQIDHDVAAYVRSRDAADRAGERAAESG